jgi:hypothetical protein
MPLVHRQHHKLHMSHTNFGKFLSFHSEKLDHHHLVMVRFNTWYATVKMCAMVVVLLTQSTVLFYTLT